MFLIVFKPILGAREWSQSIPLENISPNMGSKVDFDEISISSIFYFFEKIPFYEFLI